MSFRKINPLMLIIGFVLCLIGIFSGLTNGFELFERRLIGFGTIFIIWEVFDILKNQKLSSNYQEINKLLKSSGLKSKIIKFKNIDGTYNEIFIPFKIDKNLKIREKYFHALSKNLNQIYLDILNIINDDQNFLKARESQYKLELIDMSGPDSLSAILLMSNGNDKENKFFELDSNLKIKNFW